MENKRLAIAWVFKTVLLVALIVGSDVVLANAPTGMPWEGPLDILKRSLTGPVAGGVSFIAIVASGATLVFGGELGEFSRRIIMIALAVGLMMGSGAIVNTLFGGRAAMIL